MFGNPLVSLLIACGDLARIYNKIRTAEDANDQAVVDEFGQKMYQKGRKDQLHTDTQTAKKVLKERKRS